jgi:hypothetical protein
MLTFSQYESYFEDLATRFIPIGHTPEVRRFAMMDIDEIISLAKTGMDMDHPCLILENPEGKMEYKHDRILDENLGAFHIIKRVSRGDATKKREVMDLTKAIGTKLVAKMQLDKIGRFKGDNTIPRMILYFNLSEVSYNKIGPIFSDCYGWRFTFELGQEDQLPYDADDWLPVEV